VNVVRDWLKIEGRVGKPKLEHPIRTIQGMNCTRSEVSGQRFWGLMRELCQTPQSFFKYCFVHNYCPLSFMLESGKNVTPPELKAPEKNPLFEICDDALCKTVHLLKPKLIVGVGKFAEERATRALSNANLCGVKVNSILHPSPVNPAANKGWKEKVMQQINELGIRHYLKPHSPNY
jgi:single-strand selective monofunctional uracil DNA glycosylase